jgi:hypothetical protein
MKTETTTTVDSRAGMLEGVTMNDEARPIVEGMMTRIDDLLAVANGRRRTRLVSLGDALGCVRSVLDGKPWDYFVGGTVAGAYGNVAWTTVVLVARVGESVYVGASTANAQGSPTPGRAWRQIQPWRAGMGPAGDAAAKWAAWAALPTVAELSPGEIDAFLESQAGL